MIYDQAKPDDFIRPGHVFPLTAKEGGVLRRTGHTEAAIDFARLAGFKPAGVIVEIMNSDGSMARLPELRVLADELSLKLVSIESLVAYRMRFDSLIEIVKDDTVQTKYGTFQLKAFRQKTNQQIHIALTKGEWTEKDKVLTRIQSLNTTLNIMQTLQGNDDDELDYIFKLLVDSKNSCLLFINNIDNINSVEFISGNASERAKGSMSKMDEKDFGIGAQILFQLNIQKLVLLSNSDQIKRVGLAGYGLEIVEYVGY